MVEELWLHKKSTQCRCRDFTFWHDVDIWTRIEPDIFTKSLIGSNILAAAKGKLVVRRCFSVNVFLLLLRSSWAVATHVGGLPWAFLFERFGKSS